MTASDASPVSFPASARYSAIRVTSTWEIDPEPGGVTKLTVVHDELDNAPKTADHISGGWSFILSSLKRLLETGSAVGERSTGAA